VCVWGGGGGGGGGTKEEEGRVKGERGEESGKGEYTSYSFRKGTYSDREKCSHSTKEGEPED